VAVGEERLFAIPQILYQKPETQVIVLDDAFQHRRVTAGLNIILTEYNNLFTRDFLFPTGDLRDIKSSYKRAEIIIVTKCKNDLSEKERTKIIQEINPQNGQKIYFSTLKYDTPYHLFTKKQETLDRSKDVLLICGIANPQPLKMHLMNHVHYYQMTKFADHHIFTSTDLKEIKHLEIQAVKLNGMVLEYVITPSIQILKIALKTSNGAALQFMSKHEQTYDMCKLALSYDKDNLK
jgi:tetraacyldisaccharide 4'-kinase